MVLSTKNKGGSMRSFTIRFSDGVYVKLKELSELKGWAMTTVVREAIKAMHKAEFRECHDDSKQK